MENVAVVGVNRENKQSFNQDEADRAEFWALINAARQASGGDVKTQAVWLTEALAQKSVEDIIRFGCLLQSQWRLAHRRDVWQAATRAWGYCSESSMNYLCAWLISQGRAFLRLALTDTDALSDVLAEMELHGESAMAECLLYVAQDAYGERTGGRWPAYFAWSEEEKFLYMSSDRDPPVLVF